LSKVLIGFTLMAEGLEFHTPKGYIYFAMAFSFGVELLNIRAKRKRAGAVHLRAAQFAGVAAQGQVAKDEQ
jgi:predicted tellurium resistance membrane protein TerC